MKALQKFKDRSFGWAFFLASALFAGAGWGESVGLSPMTRAALMTIAGAIPMTIQLVTGYGLDGGWVARFSRSENPKQYWGSFAASAALALFFGYSAHRILVGPAN